MALHFSSEAPEDQFYTDFGNLNKFEDEVISINSILEAKMIFSLLYRLFKS